MEQGLVLSNQPCADNYFALELQAPQISAAAAPGQFVMLAAGPGTEPFLKRPMGINYITRHSGRLRFVFHLQGQGTHLLSRQQPGTQMELLGPLGQGWRIGEVQHALLVGGGSGAAPLLPLAVELNRQGVACDVLLGAHTATRLICLDDFAEAAYLRVATDDGSAGDKGSVSGLLPQNPLYDAVYCCGPRPLMAKVADWAAGHSIACQVSLEERMGCGFGVCMGCVCQTKPADAPDEEARYRRICCEGPVFDSREVVW